MNPSSNSRVAVVILNWNGKKFLEQFLEGVVKFSSNSAQIIVADNASTDGSVEYLHYHFPTVRVIQMTENTGFTGGYNRALAQVDAQYFVLLNSDIEVTSDWLEPMISFMDAHPEAGVCQPKILDYHRRDYFEYAGASGGYLDKLGYPYCRGRIFLSLEKDQGQYDDIQPVFWATGACMMIRSSIYREIGGLDERFFAHMEEIDLCWKVQRTGKLIFVVPKSVIYHVGGGTLPKSSPRKTYLNFRNNLMLLSNNLSRKEFNRIYRKRIVLDAIAAFSFIFTSGWNDLRAVIRAHLEFRQLRKKPGNCSLDESLKSSSIKKFRGTGISILFQYYLCRVRKFSKLPPASSR